MTMLMSARWWKRKPQALLLHRHQLNNGTWSRSFYKNSNLKPVKKSNSNP